MKNTKPKSFLMKSINHAVLIALAGSSMSLTSINSWAQQVQPNQPNQNAINTLQLMNGQNGQPGGNVGGAVPGAPAQQIQGGQPANPFGTSGAAGAVRPGAPQAAVPPAPGVNYNTGVNNINGARPVAVPPANAAIPNPAVAQQQAMGAPMMPPAGLPQEYNVPSPSQVRRSGNIDSTDATITILNTPDARIRELNRDLYNKGRVINEGPVSAPKSNNGVVVAHLSPGSTSPVVRVFKNRPSAIVLTDMTGQPWPIVNYDGLPEEDFTVKRLDNPAPEGSVLSITPKGSFVSGNLVLILKGLASPVNIEFVSAQKEVDINTEIRVQGQGPNTRLTSVGLPNGLDTSLLSILQGVAPKGAKELKVSSQAVQAWLAKDGAMYVRTRYKIISPAFDNVTSSPDGTYAYKMVPIPVVLFTAADGRFGEFSIEGF